MRKKILNYAKPFSIICGKKREIMRNYAITCCAVAQSRVLRTAWVPYGNMETLTPHSSKISRFITMKLCKYYNVGGTNTCAKFGWNPPARGRSTHTWNIHFLWLFFLPSFLLVFFSCAPAQAKRREIISHTMAQKTQVSLRRCPHSKCFSLFWRFGGHFAPNPQNFAPSREIPAK